MTIQIVLSVSHCMDTELKVKDYVANCFYILDNTALDIHVT